MRRHHQRLLRGQERQLPPGLFEELQSDELQANVIAYDATVSACSRGRKWQLALSLFEEMRWYALQAKVVRYNVTISA